MFGRAGWQEGDFKEPRAVAINSLGHILVSDTNNHRIQVRFRAGRVAMCHLGMEQMSSIIIFSCLARASKAHHPSPRHIRTHA